MKALLERGAVLDARDKGGLGPLHFAAGRGRRDIVQLLWSNGVNLDEESLGKITFSSMRIRHPARLSKP